MSAVYLYDSGALIAAERNKSQMWQLHHLAIENSDRQIVPVEVLAQVWRDGRKQVSLSRFLRGCEIVQLDEWTAKQTGLLLWRSRTSDIVDAAVVVRALALQAIIVTSDPRDIQHLCRVGDEITPTIITV